MLLLASTSDKLQLITSAALNTDVSAHYVDLAAGVVTPSPKNTLITTATTTDIVGSPAASTARTIETLTIRNRHATTQNDYTLQLIAGGVTAELLKVSIPAGHTLHYHEGAGFWVTNTFGAPLDSPQQNSIQAAVNALNIVVLASDVTNNNATANTIADVTGLSFAVVAGQSYFFRFTIDYTAAAATTGARFSINGPTFTRLDYRSTYSLTSSTETLNSGLVAYDQPAAANASTPLTGTGAIACMEGFITPNANGTLVARFASEVSSSAVIAKAGSLLEWVRTL